MTTPQAMNRDTIFAEIKKIFVETFELDEADIKLEATLMEDLDLDSIDAIDMVVRLQDFTGTRVPEEELKKLRTVEDIVDLVEAALSQSAAQS